MTLYGIAGGAVAAVTVSFAVGLVGPAAETRPHIAETNGATIDLGPKVDGPYKLTIKHQDATTGETVEHIVWLTFGAGEYP